MFVATFVLLETMLSRRLLTAPIDARRKFKVCRAVSIFVRLVLAKEAEAKLISAAENVR